MIQPAHQYVANEINLCQPLELLKMAIAPYTFPPKFCDGPWTLLCAPQLLTATEAETLQRASCKPESGRLSKLSSH